MLYGKIIFLRQKVWISGDVPGTLKKLKFQELMRLNDDLREHELFAILCDSTAYHRSLRQPSVRVLSGGFSYDN